MKITERLKVEHGVFLLQLRHLEGLLRRHAHPAVLAAAVETIATAEEHHSLIEDRVLYPALTETVGPDVPPLREIQADHQRIRTLVQTIRSGAFDEAVVSRFIETLREHMEREIHETFALVDEVISAERLASMCNWDVEHVFEESGHGAIWEGRLQD